MNLYEANKQMYVAMTYSTSSRIKLHGSTLQEEEGMLLAHNTNLTNLSVFRTHMKDETISALCGNTSLTRMSFDQIQLPIETASVLAHNTNISTLRLTCNGVNAQFLKTLSNSRSLTDLEYTGASDSEELFHSTTLRRLRLYQSTISGNTGTLEHNTLLTTLEVPHCTLNPKDLGPFVRNTTLKTLCINHNDVGDEGAIMLAANTTIEKLHIEDTMLRDVGARALSFNTTITELHAACNRITDRGCIDLAKSTSLWLLDVSLNPDLGQKSIVALANNTSITDLFIRGIKYHHLEPFLYNTTYLDVHYCNYPNTLLEGRLALNRFKRKSFLQIAYVLAQIFVISRYSNKRR